MELHSYEHQNRQYSNPSTITLDQVMGCIERRKPPESQEFSNWLSDLATQIQLISLQFTKNQNGENTTFPPKSNDIAVLLQGSDDGFKSFFSREVCRIF